MNHRRDSECRQGWKSSGIIVPDDWCGIVAKGGRLPYRPRDPGRRDRADPNMRLAREPGMRDDAALCVCSNQWKTMLNSGERVRITCSNCDAFIVRVPKNELPREDLICPDCGAVVKAPSQLDERLEDERRCDKTKAV